MPENYSLADLQHMARTCINDGMGLTEWEQVFVSDIEVQLERYGKLSEKQIEILYRIYSTKTP